ncbi:TolC family outer membrane protein [Litchfieldella xinjiangensis]|uniref:TolC family outer membrane protein n=1 Tax=Litchfieldella xinjiangensis TaxID=1166948 RepID=UPI0005BA99CD|nr:TolC family outer membrane protein [Halomonas xinjiangensis]
MSADTPSSRLTRYSVSLLLALMPASSAFAADLWTVARDALDNNATLSSARAGFGSVEAARDAQRGTLLPQIGGSANAAHNRIYNSQDSIQQSLFRPGGSGDSEDHYNSASLSLEATQALYDPSNRAQLEQAERQIGQQSMSVEATRQQILYEVAEAYFEILRAHDVLAARRAQEAAIVRQLEQARERFEVGLVAITDVHEAQASYDLARSQRIAAEGAMQVSFEALERLTGKRYANIEALADELPIEPPEPANRDTWVELAIENSPAIRGAEFAVEIARSGIDVSRAGQLPLVEAFANYQYADSDRDSLEGYDSNSQIGLRASLPLYTGGSTTAQIRQSTFDLEASQYDFEAQRRDTVQQVRSLHTQANNAVETVEARRQAIESNRSALEATRSGYEVGTRNIVDVLNAEQSLFTAIADHAEARYDYVLTLLNLRQQSGLLDAQTIQTVNQWLLENEPVSPELPEAPEGPESRVTNIGSRPQMPQ